MSWWETALSIATTVGKVAGALAGTSIIIPSVSQIDAGPAFAGYAQADLRGKGPVRPITGEQAIGNVIRL